MAAHAPRTQPVKHRQANKNMQRHVWLMSLQAWPCHAAQTVTCVRPAAPCSYPGGVPDSVLAGTASGRLCDRKQTAPQHRQAPGLQELSSAPPTVSSTEPHTAFHQGFCSAVLCAFWGVSGYIWAAPGLQSSGLPGAGRAGATPTLGQSGPPGLLPQPFCPSPVPGQQRQPGTMLTRCQVTPCWP